MARLARSFPGAIIVRGPIITSQPWATFQGAAVFSATTSLVAGAVDVVLPSAALVAAAGLSTSAVDVALGTVSLVASGTLTQGAVQTFFSAVALTATASLTAGGVATPQGVVSMTATASFGGGTPQQTEIASVALSATAAMGVNSQLQVLNGVVSLNATAGLVVNSVATIFSSASLSAVANLETSSTLVHPATVGLSASATLAETPFLILPASATLAGVSTLIVSNTNYYLVGAALSANSTLIASSRATLQLSVLLQGVSNFTVGILINVPITTAFIASARLIATATTAIGITQPQAYYLRQSQNWAVVQERQRHAQAMYMVGEMACFILMWHEIDFLEGLVQRCRTCYNSNDPIANRIAAVYNQPHINKCPDCFGTTFEGGFRARIVRPAIFTDTDETERLDRRGSVHPDDMNVETTWDFRVRAGDYLLRADGSRWRLGNPERTTLRTGFAYPSQINSAISYGNMRATYEEVGTVAYIIPPTDASQLNAILTAPAFFPPDFSSFEIIHGALIPQSIEG